MNAFILFLARDAPTMSTRVHGEPRGSLFVAYATGRHEKGQNGVQGGVQGRVQKMEYKVHRKRHALI